jgi:hypothetical protein
MTGLAHPLEDVLGAALVETPAHRSTRTTERRLDGWFWMFALVAGIGLLAFITR